MCGENTEIPYKIKGIGEILSLELGEIKDALYKEDAPIFQRINEYLNQFKDTYKRRYEKGGKNNYYVYKYPTIINGTKHLIKDKDNKDFVDNKKDKGYLLVGESIKVYRIMAETWLDNTVEGKVRNCVHHIFNNGKGPELSNLIWLTKEEHAFIHSK
ncbi:MAG: hypothetical protein MJ250_02560 [Alphaproteobacteria bacterium]|nr:hypothetical protein [Alphaproteobacteria bacterium]